VAFVLDKYEFNIKVDQIKKLAAKKSFQEAAAIAKEMNWQKVKDWSTLQLLLTYRKRQGIIWKQEIWQFLHTTEI
jgi:hypothetical protein